MTRIKNASIKNKKRKPQKLYCDSVIQKEYSGSKSFSNPERKPIIFLKESCSVPKNLKHFFENVRENYLNLSEVFKRSRQLIIFFLFAVQKTSGTIEQ